MSAREVALQVLTICRREDGWVNEVLKKQLARSGLDPRDAALATRLCYGVVQNRIRLDSYISQLLTGKSRNLHPVLRDVLRLGLYQLFFMDRIPASAAVNESVALAKKHCKGMCAVAASLTNGVLRSAIRLRGTLREPQTLWESYSHPEGLVSLFRAYVGQDKLEAMLMANNAAPDTVIQVNTLKTDAAEALIMTGHDDRRKAAEQLHAWGAKEILITHNTEVLAYDGGQFYTCPIRARNLSGRTGRGDTTFAGYITERLHAGIPEALLFATALVSLKMETPGPFCGTRQDVLDYIDQFYADCRP